MKNIYFAGSIRGGRTDARLYFELIKFIQQQGHRVLTEHIGLKDLTAMGDPGLSEADIYKRDIAWLEQADALIAEVTTVSAGVGYEIGKAEALGKPILCLYRPASDRSLSAMIAGNPHIKVIKYKSLAAAKTHIASFLAPA